LLCADLSATTQDDFFTAAIAAAVVPRAAMLNETLATSVCSQLPATTNATTLAALNTELGLSPDLRNIVYEVAVSNSTGCVTPPYLVGLLTDALAAEAMALDSHAARSIAFVLSASADAQLLSDTVLPLATATGSIPAAASQVRTYRLLILTSLTTSLTGLVGRSSIEEPSLNPDP
jgi:hypothetical protein